MRRISKLTNTITGEFDIFPSKLYYVTVSDLWFDKVIELMYNNKNGVSNKNNIFSGFSITHQFNDKENIYYTPGLIMDEVQYSNLNNNIEKIISIFLRGSGATYVSIGAKEFLKKNVNLPDLLTVKEIKNENIKLNIPNFGKEYLYETWMEEALLLEIDCNDLKDLNTTTSNGIKRKSTVIFSSCDINDVIYNTSLISGGKCTSGFRFFKKSSVPASAMYVHDRYRETQLTIFNLSDYYYGVISEYEFERLSKNSDFSRILKKSERIMDRSNFKTNLDDLIIGHVYTLPSKITSSYVKNLKGFNAEVQAVYLGKVIVKDKPDFVFDEKSGYRFGDKNCCALGTSILYKLPDSMANKKSRTIASGGSGCSLAKKTAVHIFYNLGQLAKFDDNNSGIYAIEEDKLNTKDKFINYVTDTFIPELVNVIKKKCQNIIYPTYFYQKDLDECGHYSIHSSSLITILNSDMEPQLPLIDLGELFDGSDFVIDNFFNKITEKTIEEFHNNGQEFKISEDSSININRRLRRFCSNGLPLLAWVTPETYNKNPDIKKAILNYLKNIIHIATSMIFFRTLAVTDRISSATSQYHISGISNIKDLKAILDNLTKNPPSPTTKFKQSKISRSTDFYNYTTQTLQFLNLIFGDLSNISFGYIVNMCYESLNYTSNCFNSDYAGILTNMVKSDTQSFFDVISKLNQTIEKIADRYELRGIVISGTPNAFAEEFFKNQDDVNEVYNVIFNWTASVLYKEYKTNGVFKGTELDWIDKFDIKENELYGFDFEK